MRTKIIAVLLAVLTALGGLNLFKSIRDRLLAPAEAAESSEHFRIKMDTEIDEDFDFDMEFDVMDANVEVMIDETFKVRDGQTLFADISHADISVETGADHEAHIQVTLSGVNMAWARDVFADMEFSVRQVGDEIRIVSEDRRNNWRMNNNDNVDINVVAYIPASFNLQLATTHGDIDLEDIDGNISLKTTHGDLSAATIQGHSLSVETTHGDIEAESIKAESVILKTTHADIEVGEVSSKTFSASTTHSDIEIGKLRGKSELSTTHGDIEVDLLSNERADFETSHGNIVIYTAENASAELDLEGARVQLDRLFKFSGKVGEDEVHGNLNGGGAIIKAHTTHGSVSLRSN